MDRNSTTSDAPELFAGEAWFEPIETGLRDRVRGFIEEMVEHELALALGRERYARVAGGKGYRNGARRRQLIGSFGAVEIRGPGWRRNMAGRRDGAARRCPAMRG
jgi:putative transposase